MILYHHKQCTQKGMLLPADLDELLGIGRITFLRERRSEYRKLTLWILTIELWLGPCLRIGWLQLFCWSEAVLDLGILYIVLAFAIKCVLLPGVPLIDYSAKQQVKANEAPRTRRHVN